MHHTDDGTLTIGEFAESTGLSRKALRLYDERGLLRPAQVDAGNGYRRYALTQVSEGALIGMLRALDMSLDDIAGVLSLEPSERPAAISRYWYDVERSLDVRRDTVRRVRNHDEALTAGYARSHERDDGFEMITSLAENPDPIQAGDGYVSAVRQAYWEKRDLELVRALVYSGAGQLLAAASAADPETADVLRSTVKGLMYDLASFTWRGWDEPDVKITAEAETAGLAAASTNLSLAVELNKGDLPLSRAHWMLGAHLLTSGRSADARTEFESSATCAERAGADPEADLSRAFVSLAALAMDEPEAALRLAESLSALERHDHGDEFVGQVETARRVLGLG